MSPPFDHFDLWESLDVESLGLTQTEFWTQVQYDSDRMDLLPPTSYYPDSVQNNQDDWRIMETQEETHKENIVHHDCMWAGSCADSVHPGNTFVPSDPITTPTPGQSLLRRDMSPSRPETPPSVDGDEPPQFRHTVDVAGTALRLLRDSAAVAADHSYYTLDRRNMDHLGVQTPSDSCESEEEIDVVSLGTQQPMQAAQMYMSTDSSSPSTSSSFDRQYVQWTAETSTTPRSPRPAARKRLVPPPSIAATTQRKTRGPGRRGRRSNTDTDSEAESPEIERRSIHNNMERQRRIGLKNLFEELKKVIPATRDKERAPKVVILREAASLCRKLYHEDIEKDKLKKKQGQLVTKLKKLRTALAPRYQPY